jgi:pseudouridine synthase
MATMTGGLRRLGTFASTVGHNSNSNSSKTATTGRAFVCRKQRKLYLSSCCQYKSSRKLVTTTTSFTNVPQDPNYAWDCFTPPLGKAPSLFQSRTFSSSATDMIVVSALDKEGEDHRNDQTTTPTALSTTTTCTNDNNHHHHVRLSKLLSQHTHSLAISRREAERLIKMGQVTVAGQTITSPHYLVNWEDISPSIQTPGIVKVHGKGVRLTPPPKKTQEDTDNNNNNNNNIMTDNSNRRIWIVHKLRGEVVAEFDPQGRPSMLERLVRSGMGKVGKNQRSHIKPIGRLDMMTEGLILVTTCGQYAREMELPTHKFHRTYRVRVHGPLTKYKIQAIQRGISIRKTTEGKKQPDDDSDTIIINNNNTGHPNNVTRYAPMKVDFDLSGKGRGKRPGTSTNSWITITCTEGKNRQIRNVLQHLGCKYELTAHAIQYSLGFRVGEASFMECHANPVSMRYNIFLISFFPFSILGTIQTNK